MEKTIRTIRRFDVASVCKIVFFTDLIFMAVFGVPFLLLAMLAPAKPGQPPFFLFPVIMVVLHPILATAAAGFGCTVYNFMSSKFGGIKIEVE